MSYWCSDHQRQEEGNHVPVKNLVEVDPRDVADLDKALDALERLHDGEYWSSEPHVGEPVRKCLCQEAASWRRARLVLNAYKAKLGLKIRLLDVVESPPQELPTQDPP